jgi:hypothetical protein
LTVRYELKDVLHTGYDKYMRNIVGSARDLMHRANCWTCCTHGLPCMMTTVVV